MYRASRIGVSMNRAAMHTASSGETQRRPEREHVGAVVLAGIAGQRLVHAHRGAHSRHLVGGNRGAQPGAVDDDARVGFTCGDAHARRERPCPDNPPASRPRRRGRPRPGPGHAPTATSVRFNATPLWSLAIASRRTSATGTRSMAAAPGSSEITVTRRSRSVSAASGVTCPRGARTTVLPGSSTRASASVMMSNRFSVILPEDDTAPPTDPWTHGPTDPRTLDPCYARRSGIADENATYLTVIRRDYRSRARARRRDCRDDAAGAGSLHLVCVLKGAVLFLADLGARRAAALHVRLPRGVELRRGHDNARAKSGCSRTSTPPSTAGMS